MPLKTGAMEPSKNIHAQNQRDAHAEEVLRLQGSQTPFGMRIWWKSFQRKNNQWRLHSPVCSKCAVR
jgi:hypothetical protein